MIILLGKGVRASGSYHLFHDSENFMDGGWEIPFSLYQYALLP